MELTEHPMLAAIPQEHRRRIGIARQAFTDGTVLLGAGQHMDSVFFVLKGEVRLVHRDPQLGTRSIVDVASPGEAVTLPTDATDRVSRFEAVAPGAVETAVLSIEDYAGLLSTCLDVVRLVASSAAARLRLLEDRLNSTLRIDPGRLILDDRLIERLTPQYIWSKKVLPAAMHAGTVTVGVVSSDTAGIDADMKRILGATHVVLFRIGAKEFEKIYRDSVQSRIQVSSTDDEASWFRAVRGKEYAVQMDAIHDTAVESARKETELDGAGVVMLTNKILGEALDLEASDIHFEPYTGGMDIRYRIDGELLRRPEKVGVSYLQAVLSRLKVVSGLDIAEKRKPQDGRMTVSCQGKVVDVRVSSVPTRHGEKIVLRILDPSTMLIELDSLVSSREVLAGIERMVRQPYGLILVGGPTGSGKTTTIYSMLLRKMKEAVNIMTVEDPIEYSLRGITQVQRNIHVGLDFSSAVRAFLRQDPDVIIVGETRDPETAKAALEAGLTGHLVISTIHANNVFSTIYRLKEMGMEAFVVASSMVGVLSQRLVRRICSRCAQTVQYHRSLVDPLGLRGLKPASGDYYHLRKGTGCPACNFKGYKGRVALFEMLQVTDELRPLLASEVPFKELEKIAAAGGAYVNMRQFAALLLQSGLTTPEELSRVLFAEGAAQA
ncbi:MAG: type II/IV secretion system protein [Deltaproteobacteria bacterium]|nr:type II/IV secretion system protein [Deltaproteobacteria bacterium]